MIKLFILMMLLRGGGAVADTGFGRFAERQAQLFQKAYEARDTVTYNSLLAEFLGRYDKLGADERRNFTGYHFDAYYNLCCTFALMGQKERAFYYLDESIKAGMTNYTHLLSDPDLVSIRDDPRFKPMVEPTRRLGDYMYILAHAGAYNTSDKRPFPAFTYAPASDPNLAALRKGFNLDSIAGGGNEASQVINLLHWIHDLVPHDGQHNNPAVMNAMSLITVCKRDNRGLNCRGLATVLNECYLAMGFKSRFVTCLPKDSLHVDNDCHVIDMVYLPSLRHWVWMDPTNDAYVMDERGQLLDIASVRERVIDGRMLIVNPDANWNRRQSTLKEDYLYNYMAKNLYMLECNTNSGFDVETAAPGKKREMVLLLPLDYFKQGPDSSASGNFVTYRTNNPGAFWAAPN
ncbi:MAG TPA: transglutaminase domain-containing protein [Dinghuibacter sp.]|uniref:TPR end-of-group domain-containing protein n=1 Tax=Dinghuibacter sp. TaxID=2024697 RepID=UPI002BDA23BE|nr:transglutaminase domain-containing protein [Dinghuibacter sp.]HTJ14016.1 transglutaminase domain-containing protein [Dinghuibacter sp.]